METTLASKDLFRGSGDDSSELSDRVEIQENDVQYIENCESYGYDCQESQYSDYELDEHWKRVETFLILDCIFFIEFDS